MKLDSPERLEALERSGLLRHVADSRLKHLCYTATQLIQADAAHINMITGHDQVHIAMWPPGQLPRHTPLHSAACPEVVLHEEPVVITDTKVHPIMCEMPWTAHWQGYLGVPITLDGQCLGAFCVLSVEKRQWSRLDVMAMESLAELVLASISEDPTVPG